MKPKSQAVALGTGIALAVFSVAFSNRHGLRTVAGAFVRHTLALRSRIPFSVAFGETYRSDPWFALAVGLASLAVLAWMIAGVRAVRAAQILIPASLLLVQIGVAGIGLRHPVTWVVDQIHYLGRVVYACDTLTFACIVGAGSCIGYAALSPRESPEARSAKISPRDLAGLVLCIGVMVAVRFFMRPLARQHVLAPVIAVAATFGLGMRKERGPAAIVLAMGLTDVAGWGWVVGKQCRALLEQTAAGNVLDLAHVETLVRIEQHALVILAVDLVVGSLFAWAVLRPHRAVGWQLIYAIAPLLILSALAAEALGIARTLFAFDRTSAAGSAAIPTSHGDLSRLVVADRRKNSAQRLPRVALPPESRWAATSAEVPRGKFAWLVGPPRPASVGRRPGLFAAMGSDGVHAIVVERIEESNLPMKAMRLRAGPTPLGRVPPFTPLALEIEDEETVNAITGRLVLAANAAFDAAGSNAFHYSPAIFLVRRAADAAPVATPPSSVAREPKAIEAKPSAGCANGERAQVGLTASTDAETKRSYLLYTPIAGPSVSPRALVLALHGAGGTGADMQVVLDMESASKSEAYVAYPDGRGRIWDFTTPEPHNPDVVLLDALVRSLSARHCIDLNRIYVAGYSMGGYLAQEYACARPAVVRAVATFSAGGPYGAFVARDEEGRPRCASLPALVVHGALDTNVDPRDGLYSRELRRLYAQCSAEPRAVAPSPCVEYANCATASTVRFCSIPGLEHYVWKHGAQAAWSFWDSSF